MKKLLLQLFTQLVCSTFLFSQSDSINYSLPRFITEGTNRYCSFSNLNKILLDNGFTDIPGEIFGISLGYWSPDFKQKGYSTFVFSLFSNQHNSVDNRKSTKLEIAEFAIQYHRVISNRPKWFFYPYLGFGSSFGRLTLMETVNNLDFDESISDLSTIETYKKRYFTNLPIVFANVGIGVDRKITLFEVDYFWGLTFGYKLSTKSDWGYVNSPRMNFGGFEVNFRIRFEYSEKYYKKFLSNHKFINLPPS